MARGSGGINVGAWTGMVIGLVVLLIVLAALMPTYTKSLFDYDNNTTDPIAPVLQSLGPILLSVAILLLLVYTLLGARKGR